MWWIIIPVVLLISILIYLLFAPFFIEIDSSTGLYRLRFHRFAGVSLIFHDESIFAFLQVAWWHKEFDLLNPEKQPVVKPVKKVRSVKRNKSASPRKTLKRVWHLVKSFKLTKCHILLDTGDMPTNGILYPLFYLLSRTTGKTILINFWGENLVILQIKNTIARILWAYIKT